jgi:tetratricopeptide (TPR) repeat protein
MATNNVKQGQPAEVTLNKQEAFFMKYRKAILIAVAAVIILIVGFILYKNYISGPREDKASTVLAMGQDYFNSDQFEKALNGDGAGYPGFLKVASDYSSTDAGNLAHLYAGLCYANLNKWNEAVNELEKFSGSNDQMISPAAQAALGNAYAHLNQLDKAVSALKKAADMADSKAESKTNNSLSPTFLIQAGEILESQGKKADALKIYQDIKQKYVNSAISREIDKYIERASK